MSSLALDVGGTYIKAARIRHGSILGPVVRRPVPDFVEAGFDEGAREFDPSQLDSAVFAVLAELGIEEIRSHTVFVSGQMAGLAFVDADGHAVRNIISWQDTRYQNIEAIAGALTSSQLTDLGDGLRVGSPAVTLAEHGVPKGSFPTSLIAYVAGRLAGTRATRVHATDAGAWGLFDTRNMCWSQAACGAASIDTQLLPSVRVHVEPIIDESRVFTGVGDQQAALLGAGVTEGMVSVNLATGCQVSILARKFSDRVQTRPYFGGNYLHTVTHLPAGRLLSAAVQSAYGSNAENTWSIALADGAKEPGVARAIDTITDAVGRATELLGAVGRPVLFTGGIVQRFAPLRDAIIQKLRPPEWSVYTGDDAALEGLARLAGNRV